MGAWIEAVNQSAYKVGVYCSGIAVPAGSVMIATAQDVATRFPNAKLWVWNDRCPPAPAALLPGRSSIPRKADFLRRGYGNTRFLRDAPRTRQAANKPTLLMGDAIRPGYRVPNRPISI
jgi:hypothetical protein